MSEMDRPEGIHDGQKNQLNAVIEDYGIEMIMEIAFEDRKNEYSQ
jgi:hypothetical protein